MQFKTSLRRIVLKSKNCVPNILRDAFFDLPNDFQNWIRLGRVPKMMPGIGLGSGTRWALIVEFDKKYICISHDLSQSYKSWYIVNHHILIFQDLFNNKGSSCLIWPPRLVHKSCIVFTFNLPSILTMLLNIVHIVYIARGQEGGSLWPLFT